MKRAISLLMILLLMLSFSATALAENSEAEAITLRVSGELGSGDFVYDSMKKEDDMLVVNVTVKNSEGMTMPQIRVHDVISDTWYDAIDCDMSFSGSSAGEMILTGLVYHIYYSPKELPDRIELDVGNMDFQTLWLSDEAAAEDGKIPKEVVGTWRGSGMHSSGYGNPIDLTVRIEADGSGEFTFVQGDYQETGDFTLNYTDNRFSLSPKEKGNNSEGTWALEDGILTLDISTPLPDGRIFTYTVACEKAEPEEQPWPSNGAIWRADSLGEGMELKIDVNQPSGTGMHIKIYRNKTELVAMLFVGGSGSATVSLPGGMYTIKDGTGEIWYRPEESFGDSGNYEVMSFDGGATEVELEAGYSYVISINVKSISPDADSVGSKETSHDAF